MGPDRRSSRRGLLLMFFLSGAAGLIYEVVWARQLVLVFGNTTQAVSTILTGFFGGLALGSAIGGRIADRLTRPLRLYAALEFVVAAIVLLTPLSFGYIAEAYRGVYPTLSEQPLFLALMRFAFAILALAPATVLMGATLPTLARHLVLRGSGMSRAFRRLYLANTVGAIAGTAVSGFILIELAGLTSTLAVGAGLSAAAGVIAVLFDRREPGQPEVAHGTAPDDVDDAPERPLGTSATPPRARARTLALTIAFISGLTSIGYQVVWNRLMSAGTGSSTYVFTIILVLFLTGIAVGAGLLGELRHRVRSPILLIAGAQIATAFLAVVGAAVLSSPSAMFSGATAATFLASLGRFAAMAVLVVLPATIALGITFPATAALLGDESGTEGTATGGLLGVNTVGSLAATFVLPFFIIPAIGSPLTFLALVVTNACIGLLLSLGALAHRRTALVLVPVAAGVVAVAVVATAAGVAFQNPTTALIRQQGGTVYEAAEDEIAEVEAGTVGGAVRLWVAGTSMTALTADTKFMPLLPLALRPTAKQALVVAFGMGTSYRTALRAGLSTDAVELVPSVPGMFHWFYDDAPGVMANPSGSVTIADGRNYVVLTTNRYDLIVTDPPPPIESAGVSVISTVEYYEAVRRRLAPNGVGMQWVPMGQSVDEFLAHVRSFSAVFPNASVIAGPGGHGFFILGSEGPVSLDRESLLAVLGRPGVLEDVNEAPDSNELSASDWADTILSLRWAEGDRLRQLVGSGPLVTDDRPLPEYFVLRRLMEPDPQLVSLEALRALR